ncbi:MAG: hypothetical protein ACI4DK_13555 [Lachnospiraceae bacterium]
MGQKKHTNNIPIPKTPTEKATFIMNILEQIEIQHTQNGIMAYVNISGKKIEMPIDSKKFQSIIASHYFSLCKEVASIGMIKNCIMSFQGSKFIELDMVEQKTRMLKNKSENALYIDKADDNYHYFKITANNWTIEKNGQKFFCRNHFQGEMPTPDVDNANVEKIFEYCRIPISQRRIFIAYVISCFIPTIEHPCLVLEGEKGAGKTTVSRFLKALIDPKKSDKPNANALPKDIQEIVYAYKHNYLLAFDNLESLKRNQSDFLCSVITGIDFTKRKLFTDDDICSIDLCQPVILNGISNVVTRDDLITRSIIITLEKPCNDTEENDNDEEFIEAFMKDRSIILGGIFDILIDALKHYKPNSVPNRPRMSSFYEWGYYICEAWKKGYGNKFCDEYCNLINRQTNEGDWDAPLPHALLCLIESQRDAEWSGTISDLVTELKEICNENDLAGISLFPIPLSKQLKSMQKYIESQGIGITWGKTKNNCTTVSLSLKDE